MHDDRRRRSLFGSNLILVGPPSVIGHGVPPKHLFVELRGIGRIRNRRVVDEHQQRLALQVNALVIVPAVLPRHDSVTDEDNLGVFHPALRPEAMRDGNVFIREMDTQSLAARGEEGFRLTRNAHQRHLLQIGSIRISGLEAESLELLDQIVDGLLLARCSRRAALKLIRRKRSNVLQQVLRLDAVERGSQICARRLFGHLRRLSRARRTEC